ncbi:MAG: DUF3078 domain-containing protein [Ferruginibacter sp.]
MKKQFSLLIFCSFCFMVQAQDVTVKKLKEEAGKKLSTQNAEDSLAGPWKKGGQFSLNINQGSLSNWSAGGEKFSFSLNAYTSLFAMYKQGKQSWDNTLDLAYGLVNTSSLGNRKSSDRLELTTKYGHAISTHVNLAALINLRSQFANGYKFSKGLNGEDSATLTSKTFTPAYLLGAVGLDYKPSDIFSLFVSPLTARWVIVGDDKLAPFYAVPPGKNSRQELGAFSSATLNTKLGKTSQFKSKLDLFSNYKSNPQNIDVFWTNVLTAKISKYINFSINIDMIYDDNTQNVDPNKGPAPQFLQLMGIGFTYTFEKKKKTVEN